MPEIVLKITSLTTHFAHLAVHQGDDGMIGKQSAANAVILYRVAQAQFPLKHHTSLGWKDGQLVLDFTSLRHKRQTTRFSGARSAKEMLQFPAFAVGLQR